MKKRIFLTGVALSVAVVCAKSVEHPDKSNHSIVELQRQHLDANTKGKGFGPQSPRDIDTVEGENPIEFADAPHYSVMNLCNIHFHESAEHKGGEFTLYAGDGDGHGYHSGYKYNGTLSKEELKPYGKKVCASSHDFLEPGDTIEVHYVYSSATVNPGPTLNACVSEAVKNPQLRVEAQVFVVVNDDKALDFRELAKVEKINGYYQAVNLPNNSGKPVVYDGSTTGPKYNEHGSPYQVTWSVRPKVLKVNIASLDAWCQDNIFKEDHAHGVRNLVVNPRLLSDE